MGCLGPRPEPRWGSRRQGGLKDGEDRPQPPAEGHQTGGKRRPTWGRPEASAGRGARAPSFRRPPHCRGPGSAGLRSARIGARAPRGAQTLGQQTPRSCRWGRSRPRGPGSLGPRARALPRFSPCLHHVRGLWGVSPCSGQAVPPSSVGLGKGTARVRLVTAVAPGATRGQPRDPQGPPGRAGSAWGRGEDTERPGGGRLGAPHAAPDRGRCATCPGPTQGLGTHDSNLL